jgi:uncharacterized protein (TIGR03085 family)
MSTFAKRERQAICQTLRQLGPDAPTLCSGWNSTDLLVHLLLRENRPDAAIGVVIPIFKSFTNKISDKYRKRPFEDLIKEFENGPKKFSPFALPGLDNLANSFELLVHHEDLLRGKENFIPRELSAEDKKFIWSRFTKSAKIFLFKAKVGIVAESEIGSYTLKSGKSLVKIKGDVVDLVLFSFGRSSASRITFEGDESDIRILKETKFGF